MRHLKDGQGYELRRRAPVAGAVVAAASETAAPGAELIFYDVFGEDLFGGISARKVIEDLQGIGTAPVDVRLNSPGGDVFEGLAIYNALARHPGKVTVHVDALAASIATVVAMAGDRIVLAPSALMMVHHASSWAAGGAEELRHMAAVLEKADDSIFGTYAARTGRKAATFLQKVDAQGGEWWLAAAEAVKEGLADEVVDERRQERIAALLDPEFRLVPRELMNSAPVWIRPTGAAKLPQDLEVAPPRRQAPPAPEPAAPKAAAVPAQDLASAARRRRMMEVERLGS